MSEVEITVRGAHTAFAPPERATVSVNVALEAADPKTVHAAVVDVAAQLQRSIEPLHRPDSGPVTWWSSDQIRTWANRPWNKDGKRLPLVFHARTAFQVKFSDFDVMSQWVTQAVEFRGAAMAGIEWALTAAHRERLLAEVRAGAVRNAVDKAQAYADALGSGQVRVLALADAGMLGEGMHPVHPEQMQFARMADAGGSADQTFTPNDISVTVEVDARLLTA